MSINADEIQTNLVVLFERDKVSFAQEVEQNFELLRDLLMKGQGINGTFISADGIPQTITVENGIIVGIA